MIPEYLKDVLKTIPRQPQMQNSRDEQLAVLRLFANRLGLYDAADFIGAVLVGENG